MNLRKSKQKTTSWTKQHKIISVAVVLILVFSGVFGYNKYLDWRNVQDMKSLVGAFEELKRDTEENYNENLKIVAVCASVGKFSTSYTCDLTLLKKQGNFTKDVASSLLSKLEVSDIDRCEILSQADELYLNAINCNIKLRLSNKESTESIFGQYDTSL